MEGNITGKTLIDELDAKLRELGDTHDSSWYVRQAIQREKNDQEPKDVAGYIVYAIVSGIVTEVRKARDSLEGSAGELALLADTFHPLGEMDGLHKAELNFDSVIIPLSERTIRSIRALISELSVENLGIEP